MNFVDSVAAIGKKTWW